MLKFKNSLFLFISIFTFDLTAFANPSYDPVSCNTNKVEFLYHHLKGLLDNKVDPGKIIIILDTDGVITNTNDDSSINFNRRRRGHIQKLLELCKKHPEMMCIASTANEIKAAGKRLNDIGVHSFFKETDLIQLATQMVDQWALETTHQRLSPYELERPDIIFYQKYGNIVSGKENQNEYFHQDKAYSAYLVDSVLATQAEYVFYAEDTETRRDRFNKKTVQRGLYKNARLKGKVFSYLLKESMKDVELSDGESTTLNLTDYQSSLDKTITVKELIQKVLHDPRKHCYGNNLIKQFIDQIENEPKEFEFTQIDEALDRITGAFIPYMITADLVDQPKLVQIRTLLSREATRLKENNIKDRPYLLSYQVTYEQNGQPSFLPTVYTMGENNELTGHILGNESDFKESDSIWNSSLIESRLHLLRQMDIIQKPYGSWYSYKDDLTEISLNDYVQLEDAQNKMKKEIPGYSNLKKDSLVKILSKSLNNTYFIKLKNSSRASESVGMTLAIIFKNENGEIRELQLGVLPGDISEIKKRIALLQQHLKGFTPGVIEDVDTVYLSDLPVYNVVSANEQKKLYSKKYDGDHLCGSSNGHELELSQFAVDMSVLFGWPDTAELKRFCHYPMMNINKPVKCQKNNNPNLTEDLTVQECWSLYLFTTERLTRMYGSFAYGNIRQLKIYELINEVFLGNRAFNTKNVSAQEVAQAVSSIASHIDYGVTKVKPINNQTNEIWLSRSSYLTNEQIKQIKYLDENKRPWSPDRILSASLTTTDHSGLPVDKSPTNFHHSPYRLYFKMLPGAKSLSSLSAFPSESEVPVLRGKAFRIMKNTIDPKKSFGSLYLEEIDPLAQLKSQVPFHLEIDTEVKAMEKLSNENDGAYAFYKDYINASLFHLSFKEDDVVYTRSFTVEMDSERPLHFWEYPGSKTWNGLGEFLYHYRGILKENIAKGAHTSGPINEQLIPSQWVLQANEYYKIPYPENPNDKASWNNIIVYRPWHGLAHAMRKVAIAKDLAKEIHNLPDTYMIKRWLVANEDQDQLFVDKLMFAALYLRSGRGSEDPNNTKFAVYINNSAQNFLKEAKKAFITDLDTGEQQPLFSQEQEINEFKDAIIAMGIRDHQKKLDILTDSGSWIHNFLWAVHTFDLRRIPEFDTKTSQNNIKQYIGLPSFQHPLILNIWNKSGDYLKVTGDRDRVLEKETIGEKKTPVYTEAFFKLSQNPLELLRVITLAQGTHSILNK